jgi:hypothetical protein
VTTETTDTTDAADAAIAATLELDDDERELVTLDLDALLPTLDADRRARYTALREAVVAGQVPGDLVPALESLLELTLQIARARARYRAEGEQTLTKLYRRTPGGRELSRHLGQVNDALATLAGQTIESLSVRMRTVGHFTLTIQTDATTITLASRPDTVDVESIAVAS